MARRRHKRNPRSKYKVRHVVLKKNPRRRLRRNGPADPGAIEAEAILAAGAGPAAADIMAAEAGRSEAPSRIDFTKKRGWKSDWAKAIKREEGKQRKRVAGALERSAKAARGRAKRAKGLAKRTQTAQAARLSALAAVVRKSGRNKALKSPLIKAMTIRSNPGLGGLRILVPQAVASTAGFVGSAYLGKMLADALIMEKGKDGVSALKASYVDKADPNKQTMLAKYAPALGTLASSIALWVAANRLAPRFQIGIALGGMSAAIMQAVLASDAVPAQLPPDASFAKVVKHSLGLGEYTTVGSGIFHGVGEYTTVGQAHPFRPRNYGDNAMEWAATGGLGRLVDRGGADNATEFAPGEGGIFAKEAVVR